MWKAKSNEKINHRILKEKRVVILRCYIKPICHSGMKEVEGYDKIQAYWEKRYHPQSWKNYLMISFHWEVYPNLKIKKKEVMVREKKRKKRLAVDTETNLK